MEERAISPVESLEIIERMLSSTRCRFYDNGFAFLFWGVLIIAASLLSFVLRQAGINGMDGYVWLIAVGFGLLVTIVYYARIAPSRRRFTPLDVVNGKVWIAYVISYGVLIYLCAHYQQFAPPYIYCLLGLGMFATGGIYKFWSLYAGAVVFWVGAVICTLTPQDVTQYLITVAVMFLGYLVPGYLLWRKAKKEAHV